MKKDIFSVNTNGECDEYLAMYEKNSSQLALTFHALLSDCMICVIKYLMNCIGNEGWKGTKRRRSWGVQSLDSPEKPFDELDLTEKLVIKRLKEKQSY